MVSLLSNWVASGFVATTEATIADTGVAWPTPELAS